MVDPTSDLGEDVSEEDAPRCVACETPIVRSRSHRVITWIDSGSVRTLHFCDDDCRQDWSEA